jgi:hypothetical protein
MAPGSAGHKKPPAGHPSPEGVSAPAPPGYLPTRRAYEQGGVSIAALLCKGLLPDRSSCQEVLGFTRPTHVYMSHSGLVVKTGWVVFYQPYDLLIHIQAQTMDIRGACA